MAQDIPGEASGGWMASYADVMQAEGVTVDPDAAVAACRCIASGSRAIQANLSLNRVVRIAIGGALHDEDGTSVTARRIDEWYAGLEDRHLRPGLDWTATRQHGDFHRRAIDATMEGLPNAVWRRTAMEELARSGASRLLGTIMRNAESSGAPLREAELLTAAFPACFGGDPLLGKACAALSTTARQRAGLLPPHADGRVVAWLLFEGGASPIVPRGHDLALLGKRRLTGDGRLGLALRAAAASAIWHAATTLDVPPSTLAEAVRASAATDILIEGHWQ